MSTKQMIELRLAKHYLKKLDHLSQLYERGGEGVTEALAIFNQDQDWDQIKYNHKMAVAYAEINDEWAQVCSDYPYVATKLLNVRQLPNEHIEWLEHGLSAARRLKLPKAEALHLGNLGAMHYRLGQFEKATGYHERSLSLCRQIDDKLNEVEQLGHLGNLYREQGKRQKAREYYEQAIKISQEIGDRLGEETNLGNLGIIYSTLGQPEEAINFYQQALKIARKTGNLAGESRHLGNLGGANQTLGKIEKAIEYYQQSLDIARKIGDQRGQSNKLAILGIANRILGRLEEAVNYYKQALKIAHDIGNRLGEARQLDNLAEIYFALDRLDEAVLDGRAAFKMAQELGVPREICFHGITLGWALIGNKNYDEARSVLEIAAKQDIPQANHQASVALGVAYMHINDKKGALAGFNQAVERAKILLNRSPDYYKGWSTIGLAQSGLMLIGEADLISATEAYKQVCKIVSQKGVIERQLVLLNQLKCLDKEDILTPLQNVLKEYLL